MMTRREMELEGWTLEDIIAEAEEEAAYRAEQKIYKEHLLSLDKEEIEGIREDVYDELGLEYSPKAEEEEYDEDDDYGCVRYDLDRAMFIRRGGDRDDVA